MRGSVAQERKRKVVASWEKKDIKGKTEIKKKQQRKKSSTAETEDFTVNKDLGKWGNVSWTG